jgi:ubiquinone/menaquinone biosynthesis C-methylase UbiE
MLNWPVRRLLENPGRILQPNVKPGMTVLDLGCAMGFYTLPLARLVGPEGRVVAVDVQSEMLTHLERRLHRADLAGRVTTIRSSANDLRLADTTWLKSGADFALAAHVVHEVPHVADFFSQVRTALQPGARLLVIEPRGHVSGEQFANELTAAVTAGFIIRENLAVPLARAALLEKPTT